MELKPKMADYCHRHRFKFSACVSLLIAFPYAGANVSVIVYAANHSVFSPLDIKALFLGEKTHFQSGDIAKPVDQQESSQEHILVVQ